MPLFCPVWHGTVTLFAALDYLSGKVLAHTAQRQRHNEWLAFLKKIEDSVAPDKEIHIICDNYATHKHPRVKAWLARKKRRKRVLCSHSDLASCRHIRRKSNELLARQRRERNPAPRGQMVRRRTDEHKPVAMVALLKSTAIQC